MRRFEHKTVVVTGAASGIGRACANRFAEEGAFVVLIDREAEALETVRAQLPQGSESLACTLDIADEAGVAECIEQILGQRDRIDALCNNAGISGGDYTAVTDNSTENWRQILDVNLLGTLFILSRRRACGPNAWRVRGTPLQ